MLYEDELNNYFDSLEQKYKISDTFININEKISIFINIVAFIGITATAYFLKLSIFKYLICIVIGFIALDILGMLTDKILIGTIFIFSNIKNKLKTLFMSLKFNKLSRDKQLKLIFSTEKKREEIINSKKIYSKEEIEKIDEELKFYRENLKEIQKVDEQIEDAITRRYNNDIDKTMIYSKDTNGNDIVTTIENGYLDIGIKDTMKDLIVNFIGAVTFSVIGFLYIRNRDGYKFVELFIPKRKR